MKLANQSIRKIDAILSQIEDLLRGDFPNESGEESLKLFKSFFEGQRQRLVKAKSDDKALNRAAITANQRIREYLPVLGFILRSTNVRNSFECYHPFLEMARKLLGPDAQVILSSEWDYSPLTYPFTVGVLPDYVLIGMPAFESFNALIFPLAGHELGHSVWQTEGLEKPMGAIVEGASRARLRSDWSKFLLRFPGHQIHPPTDPDIDANVFISDIVAEISDFALAQIEEIFCDAVGVAIFGVSYMYAFRYLLAPSSGGERSLYYPRLKTRAQFLADHSGLDLISTKLGDYSKDFEDKAPRLNAQASFTSEIADEIAKAEAAKIFVEASSIVTMKIGDLLPQADRTERIYAMFCKNLPSADPTNLTDIISAGWRYVIEQDEVFNETDRSLFSWTSELILKTIEVLEVRRRINA